MDISVIVSTARLGGMDVLINSMSLQTISKYNFEIIIIDEWFPVRKYLENETDLNIKFYPPDFEVDYFDPCNGCNTGLRLASGNIICYLTDYIWVPTNFLERHYRIHEYANNRGIDLVFSGFTKRYPFPVLREGTESSRYYSIFKNEFDSKIASIYFDNVVPEYEEKRGNKFGASLDNKAIAAIILGVLYAIIIYIQKT